MFPEWSFLGNLSLAQLILLAEELHLLNSHRTLDHFNYLDVDRQGFLFDHQMTCTFLPSLLSGQQATSAVLENARGAWL